MGEKKESSVQLGVCVLTKEERVCLVK